mgnify:CR=1
MIAGFRNKDPKLSVEHLGSCVGCEVVPEVVLEALKRKPITLKRLFSCFDAHLFLYADYLCHVALSRAHAPLGVPGERLVRWKRRYASNVTSNSAMTKINPTHRAQDLYQKE